MLEIIVSEIILLREKQPAIQLIPAVVVGNFDIRDIGINFSPVHYAGTPGSRKDHPGSCSAGSEFGIQPLRECHA
jgi:hypothetical protein